MIADQIPQLNELSTDQKVELIEELWEQISADESNFPFREDHLRILEERRAEYLANPDSTSSWEEVKARLLRKINDL